jgi:3-hydroxyisobutyrate dehydrogenase-like beta-hydroxyacid dehydrogenase
MNVAWFGTGLLGRPMAEKLCESGHQLTVWNRTASKAQPLAQVGARIASTPSDAARNAECLVLMLSDATAIKDVLFGDPPVGLQDRTVLQMGTIASDESRAFAARVEDSGGSFLEAPVLGSIPQARARKLIVMVGSTPEQFARWSDFLGCFGSKPLHVGPVGSAAALKLALNQLIASLTTAFAFSLGLVRRAGLDVDLFMGVLRESALYAATFDKKLPKMQARDYGSPNFPARHMLKDVRLIARQGRAVGLDTSAIEAIEKILERTLERGHALSDYSALYDSVDTP